MSPLSYLLFLFPLPISTYFLSFQLQKRLARKKRSRKELNGSSDEEEIDSLSVDSQSEEISEPKKKKTKTNHKTTQINDHQEKSNQHEIELEKENVVSVVIHKPLHNQKETSLEKEPLLTSPIPLIPIPFNFLKDIAPTSIHNDTDDISSTSTHNNENVDIQTESPSLPDTSILNTETRSVSDTTLPMLGQVDIAEALLQSINQSTKNIENTESDKQPNQTKSTENVDNNKQTNTISKNNNGSKRGGKLFQETHDHDTTTQDIPFIITGSPTHIPSGLSLTPPLTVTPPLLSLPSISHQPSPALNPTYHSNSILHSTHPSNSAMAHSAKPTSRSPQNSSYHLHKTVSFNEIESISAQSNPKNNTSRVQNTNQKSNKQNKPIQSPSAPPPSVHSNTSHILNIHSNSLSISRQPHSSSKTSTNESSSSEHTIPTIPTIPIPTLSRRNSSGLNFSLTTEIQKNKETNTSTRPSLTHRSSSNFTTNSISKAVESTTKQPTTVSPNQLRSVFQCTSKGIPGNVSAGTANGNGLQKRLGTLQLDQTLNPKEVFSSFFVSSPFYFSSFFPIIF